MTATLMWGALTWAQFALAAAACLASWRILRGPRAQDRILGLDTLYVTVMLLFVVTGLRVGTSFGHRHRDAVVRVGRAEDTVEHEGLSRHAERGELGAGALGLAQRRRVGPRHKPDIGVTATCVPLTL